jgi:hypothetical protein
MPPRIGWVIPVAVVAVAVFAGLDAIRSFGDEPTALAPSATEAVTTPQAHAVVALDSSRELRSGRVVELIPDHVSTDERFGFVATFRAPPGWYGYQDEGGFVIGNSLSAAVLGVNAPLRRRLGCRRRLRGLP